MAGKKYNFKNGFKKLWSYGAEEYLDLLINDAKNVPDGDMFKFPPIVEKMQ